MKKKQKGRTKTKVVAKKKASKPAPKKKARKITPVSKQMAERTKRRLKVKPKPEKKRTTGELTYQRDDDTTPFGIVWQAPQAEEVGVAQWWVWKSDCNKLRVVRSTSQYEERTFFAASFRNQSGMWENVSDESGEKVCYPNLKAALLGARAKYIEVNGLTDEDVPDNHIKVVKAAEERGLDTLPVAVVVGGQESGVVRQAPKDDGDQRGKNRYNLYGMPVTHVIRWMGKKGFTDDEAKKALAAKNIVVVESTLKSQLRGGRVGKRGPVPKLSKQEENELLGLKG